LNGRPRAAHCLNRHYARNAQIPLWAARYAWR